MHLSVFILAIMIVAGARATTFQDSGLNWHSRMIELGMTSAYVVLGYSLTDNCELGQVEVVDSSNPTFFDDDTVAAITRKAIGPFGSENHEIVLTDPGSDVLFERIVTTRRLISWSTDLGHRYIECYLNADRTLEKATYIDGNGPAKKITEDIPVEVKLSELGIRNQTIEFEIEG